TTSCARGSRRCRRCCRPWTMPTRTPRRSAPSTPRSAAGAIWPRVRMAWGRMAWGRPTAQMAKAGYHHGNLRQALVEAALALIAEKGPQGFTLSEAAKEAGVTPAAVYRHFQGREDLLAEVARQGYAIFADL